MSSFRLRPLVALVGFLGLVAGLVVTAAPAGAAGGTFTISAPNTVINEGSGGGTTPFPFVVTYNGAGLPPSEVTITVTPSPETEENDLVVPTGFPKTVPLASFSGTGGTRTYSDSVGVVADNFPDGTEQFQVSLSVNPANGDAVGAPGTVTFTIADDDGAVPTLRISDVDEAEGTSGTPTPFTFDVTLDKASQEEVRVNYATENGVGASAATAPDDYAAKSGTLVFATGQTSKTVTVDVVADSVSESDETFRVNLSANTNNSSIADSLGFGTIRDDDGAVEVSVNDPSVSESGPLVFDIKINKQTGRDIRVQYATANGTATAGQDYTSAAGAVVFPAGSPKDTVRTVSVTLVDDDVAENDETVLLNLSAPTNAVISDAQGVGTIVDNDTVAVSVAEPDPVTEGNGSANPAIQFVLRLNRASSRTFTVQFDTADTGSATAGADYAAVSRLVTFDPGQITKGVDVTILSDNIDEADQETFEVRLTAPTSGSGSVTTGTITDDDAPPQLSILDASLTEGNSGSSNMAFTVQLSAPSERAIRVEADTVQRTGARSATANVDFTSVQNANVSFAPLATTAIVNVPILGDVDLEADELFDVVLDGASITPAAVTISRGTALGTILDDEPKPSITIDDDTTLEGNLLGTESLQFVLSLSTPSAAQVTVDYQLVDVDAFSGEDFSQPTGTNTLTFGVDGTVTLTVPVTGDTRAENDETFLVRLSNPVNANIGDAEATGTILNDDAGTVPTVSVNDVSVTEGSGGALPVQLSFTITSSAPASSAGIRVRYLTTDGTAIAPADYAATSGTATIPTGATTQTVTVTVVRDTIDEPDETMNLILTVAGNASVNDGTGIGTIVDDDLPPVLSINDVTVTEGNTGSTPAAFVVTLSNGSSQDVSVNIATSDVTAVAGIDYVSRSATLTIPAGQLSAQFPVNVAGDGIDEINETYNVTMTGPVNGTLEADPVGIGTITDDDDPPVVSVADASVVEGDAPGAVLQFAATLSQKSGFDVSVDFATSDGPAPAAVAPGDYDARSASLTIPAGDLTANITVTINPDNVEEPDEHLTVTLSNPTKASIGDGVAQGTIVDDDSEAPDITISDVSVVEGNSGTKPATFEVLLDEVSPSTVEVRYATVDGSATAGSDYVDDAGVVRFAPGETRSSVTISVKGDTVPEGNETFQVKLSQATNADIIDGTGVGRITDNDSRGTFVALSPRRILDTRTEANGAAALGQSQVRTLQVAGAGGVPATGASSVVLNVTVVNPTAVSYLSVTPDGSRTTSSLNFGPGQIIPNHVTVPLDENGAVKIFNKNGTVDVVVDVFGYYHDGTSASPGSHFVPVEPTRLGDTRNGVGGRSGRLGQGQTMSLDVTTPPAPLANVAAVVINVTVVNASEASFLSVTPTGGSGVSSMNFEAGDIRANLVTVPVGPDGRIKIFNKNGATDVVVDIFGFYPSAGTRTASTQMSLTPSRITDTRDGTGGRMAPLDAGQTMTVQIAGRGGVPVDATAVALNVTAVRGTADSYLSVTPSGGNKTSNLNFDAADIVPNQVIVPLDANGRIRIFNKNGAVDVLVDVFGAFVG